MLENDSQLELNTLENNKIVDDEPPSISELKLLRQDVLKRHIAVTNVKLKTSIRERFYAGVSDSEWDDWHWQIRNSFKSYEQLKKTFGIENIKNDSVSNTDMLPIRITPYYAGLINFSDPDSPLYKTVVPSQEEYSVNPEEKSDPLSEIHDSPVRNIVHRYPDRVLFLITNFCSTYCRYCTRSHMVAQKSKCHYGLSEFEPAFNYIASNSNIRDVLLSGGDPFTISDEKLYYILSRLRNIPHVEIIRIGTKVPVVLPQRITKTLTDILKQFHPLMISIHFTHPDEITPESSLACTRLADAGIPLGSQTVLLKDINDDAQTMKTLMHSLLKIRVRPYYLYQCDPILGSSHFRTPVSKGLEIIKSLRGFTSGYSVPTFVVDAPGGGGKIPLLPNYVCGYDNNNLVLTNYEGKTFIYPDYISE